jgi:hypothetical protein
MWPDSAPCHTDKPLLCSSWVTQVAVLAGATLVVGFYLVGQRPKKGAEKRVLLLNVCRLRRASFLGQCEAELVNAGRRID